MTESSVSKTSQNFSLKTLAKDVAAAAVIRVSGLALTYVLQVLLARWMGITEYGIYEYVIGWTLFLGIPAELGLPRTALRLISEYRVSQDWGSLRGIVRGGWLLILLTGSLLALAAVGIVLLLNHYQHFVYTIPLLMGIGMVPLQALSRFQLETARALRDIPLSYIPYYLMWPALLLLSAFSLLRYNDSLTSLPMIRMAFLMLLVAMAFQFWLVREKIETDVEPAVPVYQYRYWLGISIVLLIERAFVVVMSETDILMIGSFIGPEATGLYNAAAETASWVIFTMQMINTVAAPMLVTIHAQGDIQNLQKTVARITLWIFFPSIAIGLILLVFTEPILGLFGSSFITASWTLKILVFGQMVDVMCGTIGSLMMLTGHQNKSVPVFVSCALLNLGLNAIAVPTLGMLGAALATTFSLIVWNIWLCLLVVKHIGIDPTIFYALLHWKDLLTDTSQNSVEHDSI